MAEPSSATLDVRRAAQRFRTDTDWVRSASLFSYGAHYDPGNVGFGALMVCNDEVLQSGPGYDPHPHADAEIVTWVLSGSLVHEDSHGHRGIVHPGLAQRMSAGSGIVHAERNDAYRLDRTRDPEPVHFVQMWVRPDESGLSPTYAQRDFDPAELRRGWLPVVSGSGDALIDLANPGATLWAGVVATADTWSVPSGELIHLYVARGAAELEGAGRLAVGDSVRIRGQAGLQITATEEAEILVWRLSS